MSLVRLPSLRDSKWLRLITLGMLYVAQGLPIGLFQVAIPAWMSNEGVSIGKVATFVTIAFLPWSFKLLAGPVMDRFSFLVMGRRRPWVLGGQFGIFLSLILISIISPNLESEFMLLAALGFLANFFGAIQDVAVDGMAIDILDKDERGRANAFMFGGQVLGTAISGSLGTYALANFGLSSAATILSLVVAAIALVPLLLRERPGEKLLPWSEGKASLDVLKNAPTSWKGIFSTLFKSLILPMSLLLIILDVFNKMSSGMFIAIAPNMIIQELGWAQTDFANLMALSGVVAAVFGVAMGPFIDRIGATKILVAAIVIRAVLFLASSFGFTHLIDPFNLKLLVMGASLFGQIITICIIALFMRITFAPVSATQFAVYMATANFAGSMGNGLVAMIAGSVDYPQMLLIVAGLNILFLICWPFLNLHKHDKDLENLTHEIDQKSTPEALA